MPRILNLGQKRLYKQGGSLIIVLPDMWVKLRGLKRDDVVELSLGDDDELIVKDVKV